MEKERYDSPRLEGQGRIEEVTAGTPPIVSGVNGLPG